MNDKHIDELIDQTLRDEQVLPEGFSLRLEQQIDAWAAAEQKKESPFRLRRRTLYWLSGAAAIALLCIGSLPFLTTSRQTDTYDDPREAAIVAQKALLLVSRNLNKGFQQVESAQNKMDDVNHILNKQLNN